MAHDVFISYPHQDKSVADAACANLEAQGIRCWMAPRDIAPSAEWAGSIVEAIDQCGVMVLIFSSHSNQSRQVHREVQQAFDGEKPVVPFRIENVMPEKSLRYYMGSVHWLDALTPPLEEHLGKLVSSVKALVAATASEVDGTRERKRAAEAEQERHRKEAEARRAEEEDAQRRADDERRRIAEGEAARARVEEEARRQRAAGAKQGHKGELDAKSRPSAAEERLARTTEGNASNPQLAARQRWAEEKPRREAQGEYPNEKVSGAPPKRDDADIRRPDLFRHARKICWPTSWIGRTTSLAAIAFACLLVVWLDWNGWLSFPALTLTGQHGDVTSLAFSPDGKWLASSGDLMFWDTATGAGTPTNSPIGRSIYAASVAFSPDGKWLAAADNVQYVIALLTPGSSDVARTFHMSGQMGSIAFSPDGKLIAAGNGSLFDTSFEKKTGLIAIWDVATGRTVRTISAQSPISSVAFSPDGKWIVSGSDAGTDIWDVGTGQLVRQMQNDSYALRSVVFSPDGKSIATGSHGKLILWDAMSGKQTREFDIGNSYLSSVAFSPDSKLVAGGTTGTVNVWDAATGSIAAIFRPHSCCVYSVAYSKDGKWIASGGDLGTVKLWHAP